MVDGARFRLFALSATAELGKAIAETVGQPMAVHEGRDFDDGEYKKRPGPVRDAASKRFSRLAIPLSSIAVLGDMDNDPAKFRKAGVSIAMGNASPEVKRQANHVTASNTDDGFALAIERFILSSRR